MHIMGLADRVAQIRAGQKQPIVTSPSRQIQAEVDPMQQARERNRALVSGFLPLFETLDARKQLQDLVKIWKMGRVDDFPLFREKGTKEPPIDPFHPFAYRNYEQSQHEYASLSWRKEYWRLAGGGVLNADPDGRGPSHEPTYRIIEDLVFSIDVRRQPIPAFRIVSFVSQERPKMQRYDYEAVQIRLRRSEWQDFDPNGLEELLLLNVIYSQQTPAEIIDKIPGGKQTPIRHPLLLRLGLTDYTLRKNVVYREE
jgi:hypothetical protein